jgi:type I restriction enzyme, S subunit
MSWPTVALGELAKSVDYGLTASATDRPVGPKFLRITDIQDDAVDWEAVPNCIADAAQLSRNRLADGDIVFARTGATTGKSFLVRNPPNNAVFASYLIRVRLSDRLDSAFLAHFFRSPGYWTQIENSSRGAAQPGVNASILRELTVPVPTIGEQRRITAILDKADGIRRKREQAISLTDGFLRSVFLEMFGDPGTNPKGFATRPLAECSRFISGGTPSKANAEFWSGELPWVSPKDMKVDTIVDAEDHVSQSVFEQTNLKKIEPGTPLIVVRGMILAHTIPMAMTAREVAINQDMKAIKFENDVHPLFGFWCLKVQHGAILARVDTAAHGTKRLDTDRLGEVPIVVPDDNTQKEFLAVVRQFNNARAVMVQAAREASQMSSALAQRAFRNEL